MEVLALDNVFRSLNKKHISISCMISNFDDVVLVRDFVSTV